MTIHATIVTSPFHMNFAAAAPTKAEKTLAGLISKAFIADAAALVLPVNAGTVRTELADLKADLLNKHITLSEMRQIVPAYLSILPDSGVSLPYDTTAGSAIAKMITKADANALYNLLPVGSISKPTFNADIVSLKTGLSSGQGFAELSQIV